MARRNTLRLDTSGFASMLEKLDSLNGDVKFTAEKALTKAAEQIHKDTVLGMNEVFLPAQGKFSRGTTMESIISDTTVHWEGLTGWVPVGFDFSEAGAGGFLITGTPRMQPNRALNAMYKKKKYMIQIQKDMGNVVMDQIVRAMERD